MIKTPNCPCQGCPDRSITCHSTCSKYIKWKKIASHNNELERKARYDNRGGRFL